MDSIAHLVAQYGYWAVVAGCLLEGETVLVLVGFAARQGLLSLPVVMALGACAGALSDVALFGVGRWRGAALLARWPRIASYREPLNRLLARWGAWVVVGVRFMYGMRIAGPVLLGTRWLRGGWVRRREHAGRALAAGRAGLGPPQCHATRRRRTNRVRVGRLA